MFENSFLLSLLGFLIVLTPLVFVHELGHYIAAIKNKVKVEVFSVGFGKELFGFNDRNQTRWKFCILPFGGYVKMKGELIVNEKNFQNDTNINKVKNSIIKPNDKNNFSNAKVKSGNFNHASLLSRFIIVLSGPLANIIFGMLLISILYTFQGRLVNLPIVGETVKNSSAYNAGILKNDLILKVDNQKVENFYQLKYIVENNPNKLINMQVLRENNILDFQLTPNIYFDKQTNKKVGRIGIIGKKAEKVKLNILNSFYYGCLDTLNMTVDWVRGLINLINLNMSSNDVAGPIGIAKISGDALIGGLSSLIFLMAILSINLGLINLLPIPALDGGYITLYFFELIFRKPLPENYQIKLIQFGVFFLISLMLIITFLDLKKYV